MMIKSREFVGFDQYRMGFNGKENDNEVKGQGNQQDYGMRIYDPRLGRFLSVDPMFKDYPELTVYQFASNTPIMAIDLDGLEAIIKIHSKWFLKQIQKAVDANDIEEAQRLTWVAVNAKMPDGSDAASFIPSANDKTGFDVFDDKGSRITSTADNIVYLGPKRAWAKGGVDYSIVKYINKEINSRKQSILENKEKIETLTAQMEKIDAQVEEVAQNISDADNDGLNSFAGAGVIGATIYANIQKEPLQAEVDKLSKQQEQLESEIKSLKHSKTQVTARNKKFTNPTDANTKDNKKQSSNKKDGHNGTRH